jgi:hypothetical protein
MSRKVMQMALEALEILTDGYDGTEVGVEIEAITALRQALEEKREPVAHVYLFDKAGRPLVAWDNAKDIQLGDKLYAAPKQWVGLTDEEVSDIADSEWEEAFVRLVEAKLKEKNT